MKFDDVAMAIFVVTQIAVIVLAVVDKRPQSLDRIKAIEDALLRIEERLLGK